MNQQSENGSRLSLPPVEEIARQLVETTPEAGEEAPAASEDPELVALAESFAEEVLAGAEDAATLAQQRRAVDEMALELQQQAAHQSAMLQTPLRKLAHHGDDGGPVAQALVDLRGKMQVLDPRQHRLSTGRLDRMLARIPGAGSRLQR